VTSLKWSNSIFGILEIFRSAKEILGSVG